ncbi:hypothetical protein AQS70_04805 [Pseudomonas endophytica]|uniref:DUF4234 domain-containing protein n=1 Tax=Pseudomonas endophytica TaxID=1563157 RepID=A0A0Q0SXY5_9PSED|nr:hypothetical protein [Pseudomonas endophytica]KQB51618.1 hypothetical protein AQS70_04805 [Pseudomonas endophytica]
MKPTTATIGSPSELYTVSIPKFVLLYLMTGGGFLFYWSYRNWAFYKKTDGVSITPVMRGLFWPFFTLELFEKIQSGLDKARQPLCWHPESRALLIMLLVMLSVLLLTFFDRPLDRLFICAANIVLFICIGCLFIGAQRAINVLQSNNC